MAAKKSAPRKTSAKKASTAKKGAAKKASAPKSAPSFAKGDDDPWATRNTIRMVTGPEHPPAPPSEPAETPQAFGAAPHLSPDAPISQPADASPRSAARQSGGSRRTSGQSAESTVGGPSVTRSTGAGSGSVGAIGGTSHSTTSSASNGAAGGSSSGSAA